MTLVLSRFRLLGFGLWLATVLCMSVGGAQEKPEAAATAQPHHAPLLIVRGPSGTTKALSPDRFAELPRCTVEAAIPHTDRKARYEGVLLEEILREVGVQAAARSDGSLELPRPLRSAYVLIEAADGYQAVFSLPELLSKLGGHTVVVADREDGKPLPAQAAPYRIVEVSGGGFERWVRQVRRILVQPGSASPFPPTPSEPDGASQSAADEGGVYLIGTGPGDPDLITMKAARILRTADVVFCFSWMKDELAPFVRSGTVEVVSPRLQGGRYFGASPEQYSGEERERATDAVAELAKLKARIAELVAERKTVAFADNGDPMIFSPWAWIPEQLREFHPVVIPGLSSFNAGNAAVQRSVARAGFVTLSSGTEIGSPDEHGRLTGTMVFFTHTTKLKDLLPRLRQQYPDDTPVAIVCQVSYPGEKVIQGTLGNIHDMISDADLPHLYLVYVGDALK
ncbi:MAG: SAM-dependent methyltransferase [Pirellulaceae bacterium]|nr:SAM-dependent methyltransferase [Pirellulaceae bacterium]